MGNNNSIPLIDNNYKQINIAGKGNFGKVIRYENIKTKQKYF